MSRLKILLMSKEAFWKVRAKLSRGLFYIRKAFYSASSFMNKQRTNISIQQTLVLQTIKKLILAAFLLFFSCVLDYLIFDIFGLINPLSSLNQQILSDVLIAALSISGIFLGLYFSNMTSVYSSRYANAPARVRQLFENEVVTSNSINDIILFIVISIVALLISMFGLVLKPITICFLFFLSIKNIVSFALIGKRSFQFSDVFEITTPIYKNISELYKSATYKGLFYKDINFQAHYQKNTRSNLEVLSAIATYNIECGTAKGISMLTFMCKNIDLLKGYLQSKASIPFDSKWFPIQEVYKKWYEADESEINIALTAGTSIRNKSETNMFWVEDQIYSINEKCFEQLVSQKSWMLLVEYIRYLSEIVSSVIASGCYSYFLDRLNLTYERVVEISRANNEEDRSQFLQLLESILVCYMTFFVESTKFIQSIKIDQILIKFSKDRNEQLRTASLNCKEIRDILECVITERKIERRKITPDWYINQIIARRIQESIFAISDGLLRIYIKQLKEAIEKQLYNKNYTEALLMLTIMSEAKSKFQYYIQNAEPIVRAVEAFRVDNSMPWPTATLKDKIDGILMLEKELPHLWVTASVAFTAINYSKLEQYPDLLGHCYNVLCSFLVTSIAKNDIDSFKSAYAKFWPVMRLYQDVTRQDLLNKKETLGTELWFYLFAFPMVEFCMISGYAILWGSIFKAPEWLSSVDAMRDQIASKKDDSLDPLEHLVGILSATSKLFPAIYPRDMIQSGWTLMITNTLRESENLTLKRHGPFDDERIETDDPFVNAYIGHGLDMIGLTPIYELYLVKCINPCVSAEKKYESRSRWERNVI